MIVDVKRKHVPMRRSIAFSLCAVMAMCVAVLVFGCTGTSSVETSSASASEEAGQTGAEVTEVVAEGAKVAHLKLAAERPLADGLSAECIALDGAFSGFDVQDVRKTGEESFDLTIALSEGGKLAKKKYGYVMLLTGAFAGDGDGEAGSSGGAERASAPSGDGSGAGSGSGTSADESSQAEQGSEVSQVIALAVRDPEATVVPLEGSYDADAGVFVLPVSLGHAEFVRAPEVSDFTLADKSLKVVGVDYDGLSLASAALRIEAPAESLVDTFDALDKALTKSGIAVSDDATNCGKLVIGSSDMREAAQEGHETTALSCLAPQAAAFVSDAISIESKTQDADGETDYDVHLLTTIESAPGKCVLPDFGIEEVVHVDAVTGGDEGQVLGEDVMRVDDTKLLLNVYMPSKVIDALSASEGEQALEEAEREAATFVRAHELVLDSAVLENAWGVPAPRTEVPLYLSEDYAAGDVGAGEEDAAVVALIEKAYADEGDDSQASDDSGSADTGGESSESDDPDDSDNSGNSSQGDDPDDPDNSDNSDDPDDPDDPDNPDNSGGLSESSPSDESFDPSAQSPDVIPEVTDTTEEIGDMPADLADADSSYGQVDYSAYDLANDDEDLKKAKEAFEALEKIFETAGAFARGAAGDPSGWLDGAGGVFGFISSALGWGAPGDLLTLQDVMDKLNKMDDEIRSIQSKVDQLSRQLADVEARLKYDNDLNELRKVMRKTEMYGKPLEKYVWNNDSVDQWKYDESKGIDGMSEQQKQALDTFVKHVEALQETYKGNAADDTVALGEYICGDAQMMADSVVGEYFDCLDTMFNWEPETYMYRMLYMARLANAYICGYTTATTQLQYKAYQMKQQGKDPSVYAEALEDLVENYEKVQKVIQGDVTYAKGKKTEVKESKYVAATHARSDGLIKNLVTGNLFGLDSEQLIYIGGLQGFSNRAKEPSEVTTWNYNGTVSRGNFESMAKRVGNTKYDSLWDELVGITGSKIGFLKTDFSAVLRMEQSWNIKDYNVWTGTEFVTASMIPDSEKAPNEYYGRILVTDTERHKIDDRPSKSHVYNWTADYFDLNDMQVHTAAEIYRADQKYHAGEMHWHLDLTFNQYYTMIASK